jgi:hypothetical protein
MTRIPGHPMYSVTVDGQVYSHHRNRFIRQTVRTYNGSGYHRVGLLTSSSPKKYKYYYVHQLVMLTFVGPCPEGLEIDHINLDTSNNRLSNLRYVTHRENIKSRRPKNYRRLAA